jgi:hypothetical protein
MAARRSFGGTVTAQTSFGTLVLISSFSLLKAWWAVRQARVDRHRVWMVRAWGYICSVSIVLLETCAERKGVSGLMWVGPHVEDTHGCVLVCDCLLRSSSL